MEFKPGPHIAYVVGCIGVNVPKGLRGTGLDASHRWCRRDGVIVVMGGEGS